ncbi:MAG: alpha/beta hydrolase [Deltaproteobacteria bacterium]|nr:alpha/beta hydrolase [Deltaproteobacteria bacterium]
MEKWIGNLLVDASPPEKPKFKSPLVLIHGLWSGSWCWHRWATHFSNLGWECWAVNFRGRVEEKALEVLERLSFQDCMEDLKRVIRAASFPPVLVAHSLGGLIAQKAAEGEKLSALILLSSLPPREIKVVTPHALRLLRLKYLPLLFLRRPFCLQEKDFRRSWLASLPESDHPDILKRMVSESSHLIGEFFNRCVEVDPGRIRCPVLAVGGGEDGVVPMASLREMAQRLGADLKEYPNHGHWMMEEQGGERIVRDIHRWVVQRLGEEILLPELPGDKPEDTE